MAQTLTALDLIERLVGFDTTSRDSNLALIDFVADHLRGLGIESRIIHDETGRKANLYATIGPSDVGGVALSGHTDVVPVDGQDWATDPFRVTRRDGRLYGRGTSDMKSFIAVALAMAPAFRRAKLRRPVHFAFSYDEEVGCLGVHGIVAHLAAGGPRPQLVIVGEPTEMQVVNAHKSCVAFNTRVTGLEAHSSATHEGVNAVMVAADLIGRLNRIAAELQAPALQDARFEPPYSTVHVGVVHGGTALNIIPRECLFEWEIRGLPDADTDALVRDFVVEVERDVLPAMRRIYPDAQVVTKTLVGVPPLRPDRDSPAETLAMKLVGSNRSFAVSYATEAGIFQQSGIPTIVCGPGNIREAHKPNEFIEISQVEACEAFMHRLLDYLTAGSK